MAESKSLAKQLQEVSQQELDERLIRFMVTDDRNFEYHLVKPESVVRGIIDADVPDVFLQVPVPAHLKTSVKHRYLHTSRIAILDVFDELQQEEPADGDKSARTTG
jgi:hypothetical protein